MGNAHAGLVPEFKVLCSHCNRETDGRLRFRCCACKSEIVVLAGEPPFLADLNKLSLVKGKCFSCGSSEAATVQPFTKCRDCKNEAELAEQCNICFMSVPHSQIVSLGNCGHRFCTECWSNHFRIQIEAGNLFFHPKTGYCTVKCMADGCLSGPSTPSQFKEVLSHETYELYKDKSAMLCTRIFLGGVWCPYDGCGIVMIPHHENDPKAICVNCKQPFCIPCRSRWHEGQTCEQFQESQDEASYRVIRNTTKPCPRCKAPITKNGGCNHMTCTMCKYEFCWRCLTKWPGSCQRNHWFGRD